MRIIIPNDCTDLEILAAEELKEYIYKLFKINVNIENGCNFYENANETIFFIGEPARMSESCKKYWKGEIPVLSNQGFVIRNTEKNKTWLFGGSSIATLWAVYELVERWGVVYSLQGDVYPSEKVQFSIPLDSKAFEPRQRMRSWRVFSEHFTGPTSWSINQQKKFIKQLVKQKYNGVYFVMWPQHPFIDFEIEGISRSNASFGFGMPILLTPDNIGYRYMPKSKYFNNPEFVGCKTYEDWHKCGVKYASAVFDFAKKYGMIVSLGFMPYHIPAEYVSLLQKPLESPGLRGFAFDEGGDFYNPMHIKLLKMQFDAHFYTYPQVDIFDISLPEHVTINIDQFDESWKSLDKRFGIAMKHDIKKLIEEQSKESLAAGGLERSAREAKMTIMMVDSLHNLLDETGFLEKLQSKGKELSIQAGLSCPWVIPVIADTLWDNAHLNICPAYTSSRAVRTLRVFDDIKNSKIKIDQVITLQDDNIGSLPQICTYSIDRLIEYASENNWNGYYTRYWPIGDIDPISAFISDASWDEESSPHSSYSRYIGSLYGNKAIKPVIQALNLLEDATIILDINHLSLIFPVKDLLTNTIGCGREMQIPETLLHIISTYNEVKHILTKVLFELYSNDARKHMEYIIGRMDFSINILSGYIKVIEAGNLIENNEKEKAIKTYQDMLSCFRKGLDALDIICRDDSDIGNLAVYYDVLVREPERALRSYLQNGR